MTFVLFAMIAASSSYSWGIRFAPVWGLGRALPTSVPCRPTGSCSTAQRSSKGQLVASGKLSTKNRKEFYSFLFFCHFHLLDFAIDLAAKSCSDKMKPQAREALALRGGDQRRAGARPYGGSGRAWQA